MKCKMDKATPREKRQGSLLQKSHRSRLAVFPLVDWLKIRPRDYKSHPAFPAYANFMVQWAHRRRVQNMQRSTKNDAEVSAKSEHKIVLADPINLHGFQIGL